MGDKEFLGLLMGVGLALAFVAYLIHIHRHPERFGWLALDSKAAKAAADANHSGAARPDGTAPTSSG